MKTDDRKVRIVRIELITWRLATDGPRFLVHYRGPAARGSFEVAGDDPMLRTCLDLLATQREQDLSIALARDA